MGCCAHPASCHTGERGDFTGLLLETKRESQETAELLMSWFFVFCFFFLEGSHLFVAVVVFAPQQRLGDHAGGFLVQHRGRGDGAQSIRLLSRRDTNGVVAPASHPILLPFLFYFPLL